MMTSCASSAAHIDIAKGTNTDDNSSSGKKVIIQANRIIGVKGNPIKI